MSPVIFVVIDGYNYDGVNDDEWRGFAGAGAVQRAVLGRQRTPGQSRAVRRDGDDACGVLPALGLVRLLGAFPRFSLLFLLVGLDDSQLLHRLLEQLWVGVHLSRRALRIFLGAMP